MLPSAKEIIVRSITLYRKNASLFLRYMALLAIPSIISLAASLLVSAAVPMIIILILFYIISLWISLSFIRVLAMRYQNLPVQSIKEQLAFGAHRIWPTILLSILLTLILIGGIFLLVIPGIIFFVWFAFAGYGVILEKHGVMASLKESKTLVQNRWGAVCWRLVAPAIVFALLFVLIEGVVNFISSAVLQSFGPGSLSLVVFLGIFTIIATLLSLLVTPLSAAAPTILYLELKKK